MGLTIHDRLLQRELQSSYKPTTIRGLYGNRRWVDELDIINELDGHAGCVNALSWSKSGNLLASGSDDTCLNIHSYLPEGSTKQFRLSTSIATGHTANIFSVKFMPHSNDRTLVSAAGDGEVRIFDIEYSGQTTSASSAASRVAASRTRGYNNVHNGVRYLSDGDTNARVFRSHGDRVKRVVTESSPYFFLTCSEDGEVRQWDVRQPSSAYPPQRERVFGRPRADTRNDDVPPPLISYKPYAIDLNTISCSPSQPHYIALGGSHLHCFLHDRRMLGRDRLMERGQPGGSPSTRVSQDDDESTQATQCVKKFAPNGKQIMRRTDNGHITACKISDANPNELIVSWSADWIYEFDLHRSPDARDMPVAESKQTSGVRQRVKESKSRKRKRNQTTSTISQESVPQVTSRARTQSSSRAGLNDDMALVVQYENGQSEEIPIEQSERQKDRQGETELRGESERVAYRIARATVKLREQMFSLGAASTVTDRDPTGHATSFTSVLGHAASILPEMEDLAGQWRYPLNPSEVEVAFQNQLRRDRGASCRFVQASGTLARVLGGRLHMGGASDAMIAEHFASISHVYNDRVAPTRREQFGYDFLKAILLWLDSGLGAVVEGFSRRSNVGRVNPRLPLSPNSDIEDIDDRLIPYLLELASEAPIVNLESSRFATDETRLTFSSEKAAVLAFANALKIPFADLSSAIVPVAGENTERPIAQDRRRALRFWAFNVGRGVLMKCGTGVNFELIDRAFGGLGRGNADLAAQESAFQRRTEYIDPSQEEKVVQGARLVTRERERPSNTSGDSIATSSARPGARIDTDGAGSRGVSASTNDERNMLEEDMEEELELPLSALRGPRPGPAEQHDDDVQDEREEEEEDDDNNDDDDDNDDDNDDEDMDSDEDQEGEVDEIEDGSGSDSDEGQRLLWRSSYAQRRNKEKVESHIACDTHIRQYTGHCNVKTVKDVNFYGLNDEYVVSGSDSGHLFIWDRKTTKLLNILEGDGEVVNVVQGHPYEPMLAVSGIDHTVKIFSPDARARSDARYGVGVSTADASQFSSISSGFGRRRRAHRTTAQGATAAQNVSSPQERPDDASDSEDDSFVAPNGLSSRRRIHDEYSITSENDNARKSGGRQETYITSDMLLQIARHIQARRAEGGEVGVDDELVLGPGGEGDCNVM